MWYGLVNTRYKCPNGFEFTSDSYPYTYSNCSVQKKWEPPAVEDCKGKAVFFCKNHPFSSTSHILMILERQCLGAAPDPFLGMDVVWPKSSRYLGAVITYTCPFRSATPIGNYSSELML